MELTLQFVYDERIKKKNLRISQWAAAYTSWSYEAQDINH